MRLHRVLFGESFREEANLLITAKRIGAHYYRCENGSLKTDRRQFIFRDRNAVGKARFESRPTLPTGESDTSANQPSDPGVQSTFETV